MALRVATMSPANDYSLVREPNHLLRKLILLFVLVVASALGIVLLFRQKLDVPGSAFTFFADATLGLVAGLGARAVLRRLGWFVRSIAVAAAVVVGLAVLGYLTDWQIGIGPLKFGRSTVDWMELANLVIGADMAWIVLRAWNQPVPRLVESAPRPADRSSRRRSTRLPSAALPHTQLSGSWSAQPRSRARPKASIRPKTAARSGLLARPKMVGGRSASLKRANPFRRRSQVQLALVEEHRCPYCLESVTRNDPRGVRECEVCHTLHHADCWAITGTCQVPHLN